MTYPLPDLPAIETLLVEATSRATAAGQSCRSKGIRGKDADRLVSRIMREFLRDRTDFLLVCEEDAASHRRFLEADRAFLIDPIDGTDGFDRGDPEFAHMAAFLTHGQPVAAALACPGYGWLLSGNMHRGQVWLRDLEDTGALASRRRKPPVSRSKERRAVISQSELTEPVLAHLKALGVKSLMLADSAVAFCHLLMGNADVFLRTLPNSEWDIAAGHALINIQRGEMVDLQGAPIVYGKAGLRNSGFITYSARARPRGRVSDQ